MGFLSSVVGGLEDVATGGLAEFIPGGGITGGAADQYAPIIAGGAIGAMAGNPMAGLGIGSSLYSATQQAGSVSAANAANIGIAREQMAFSAAQAQKQMDFQERMSNTAYTRAVANMKEAGINPMLAAGSPASTPGGAMGSSAGATMAPVPPSSSLAISSARDFLSTLQDLKESNSRIALQGLQGWDTAASAGVKDLQKSLIEQNITSAKMNNEILDTEAKAVIAHPGMFGYLKALNDRGLGASTALQGAGTMAGLAASIP